MRQNRLFTTTKIQKSSDPHSTFLGSLKILGTPLRALYSKWKVGASASMCRVILCVYWWFHFVTIAKMYGNLYSGRRSSKVLSWSWVKSFGLDKKSLIYITALNRPFVVMAMKIREFSNKINAFWVSTKLSLSVTPRLLPTDLVSKTIKN